MSRSIRDLRELICLSRFGFRPDENDTDVNHLNDDNTNSKESNCSILFYFDPSILNNWLALTSSRLDKLRSKTTHEFIDFAHFWFTQFDYQHKQSLFQMEFELFVEHLLLAFTPNDTDSIQINQFARQILHDIDQQIGESSTTNDQNFIQTIDIFNRCQRDDHYRTLLANLPAELVSNTTNRLHLQWMLAIRGFGLVAICTAAVEFFDKIQKTLEQNRSIAELVSPRVNHQSSSNSLSDQVKHRILIALRREYIDVMEYFIRTNQLPSNALDEQNRNILFHALPLGNIVMIDHLLKAHLPNLDINSIAQSGNSLVHLCVTLQRIDLIKLLLKFYPNLNLNQRNQQDATPLHLTIIYDDIEMALFLLQSNADATLTMKNKTCLRISTEFNQKHFIDLFSKIV